MPCLDISTNVNLDGVDADSLFSTLTTAVSQIVGKPENVIYCTSLNWSADGSTLFSGYTDGVVRVWGIGRY